MEGLVFPAAKPTVLISHWVFLQGHVNRQGRGDLFLCFFTRFITALLIARKHYSFVLAAALKADESHRTRVPQRHTKCIIPGEDSLVSVLLSQASCCCAPCLVGM